MVSTPLQRHFVIYGTVACYRPASAIDAPKRPVVATAAPADRREGLWTLLQLLRMDARFCRAVCRAHPELANPPVGPAQRLRRRA